ncbi:hypothetical protein FFLO_00348 [Filobasidium floriforme]|uniref:DNA-directed RNA polymerase III subunit RPC8 n=1 Tax=Filobasidium floriforme TaxID=5210 RepID=A0A8K0NVR5_9TREE|nr:RNA polymerase III subunit Rpc25-domain-containing protein [Filobasidium floriforme]KAG7575358.1 hypothetical protein FFLO_00348 [Filobasidium floriforme]KAH8089553.1 RNA polymerase III subunit Rpc25-domain-containing protein [Filobasidium floriforme]
MFILSRIQDSIAVHPNAFGLEPEIAVKDAINVKYSNHLIPGIGLAVSVYDILTCTEGNVRYGDGLIWYKTIFRVVVFAPTVGEIVLGKIISSTAEHIRVSVEFFNDIYVPKANLPQISTFDPEAKSYFYQPQEEPEEEEEQPGENEEPKEPAQPADPFDQPSSERTYFETDSIVRFRVESLKWQELEPEPPNVKNRPPPMDPKTGLRIEPTPEEEALKKMQRERDAPFKVIAEMNDHGLGPISWWGAGQEEDGEGQDGMEEDVDME